jgi:hypothetical protein
MFYSIFLLVLGVYFGQEYNIPSVSLLMSNAMLYLQTQRFQQIDNQDQGHGQGHNQEHVKSYITRIYEYFCS